MKGTQERAAKAALLKSAAVVALLTALGVALYQRFFALPGAVQPSRSGGQWSAFGGTWTFAGNTIENESDERGAKLIYGSPHWTNYSVSADVELEGESGDAGLMARVQEPDEGVDAFRGIYAGLRLQDNALIAGQTDYGWSELPPQPLAVTLQPYTWYHLKLSITGCHLQTVVSLPGGAPVAGIDVNLNQCSPRGQVGLRSYRSGGMWRSIRVDSIDGREGARR